MAGYLDWCQSNGQSFNAGPFCFAVIRAFDVDGFEAPQACGPHGRLAVLPSQALFTQAAALIAAENVLAFVALRQDLSASQLDDGWAWRFPDNSTQPFNSSLWTADTSLLNDDVWTVAEDGEKNFAWLSATVSDGFLPAPAFGGKDSLPNVPLCQFQGLGGCIVGRGYL